jgi:hypothetical protein
MTDRRRSKKLNPVLSAQRGRINPGIRLTLDEGEG